MAAQVEAPAEQAAKPEETSAVAARREGEPLVAEVVSLEGQPEEARLGEARGARARAAAAARQRAVESAAPAEGVRRYR